MTGINPAELHGPTAFLSEVATNLVQDGMACVPLPIQPPEWLISSLRSAIETAATVRAFEIDGSVGLGGRSPAHHLAARVMPGATAVRSVAALLDEPELADAAFIVHGIKPKDWPHWSTFLRAFRTEWVRADRPNLPLMVFCPPATVGHGDLARLCRPAITPLPWRGRMARIDTQQAAYELFGRPDGRDLATSVAASTAVELSGWDLMLIDLLSGLPNLEDRLDPCSVLEGMASDLVDPRPTWRNGYVDLWDNLPFEHTLCLLARDQRRTVEDRIWKGQVRVLLPFLQRARVMLARHYYSYLQTKLPYTKMFFDRPVVYSTPFDLELRDLREFIGNVATASEINFLRACHRIRTDLAHMKPTSPEFVLRLSAWWHNNVHLYASECPGWDWTRNGQKLTLLVGPAAGGKSTWAAANCSTDDILSSDVIRKELGMPLANAGDQAPVFVELRKRALARLSAGLSVVIDATNLKQSDRLQNVRLVPEDIPVEYVLIDRPMEQKQVTAGWRESVPYLLELQAQQLAANLDDILDADNLPNVTVRDLRTG